MKERARDIATSRQGFDTSRSHRTHSVTFEVGLAEVSFEARRAEADAENKVAWARIIVRSKRKKCIMMRVWYMPDYVVRK